MRLRSVLLPLSATFVVVAACSGSSDQARTAATGATGHATHTGAGATAAATTTGDGPGPTSGGTGGAGGSSQGTGGSGGSVPFDAGAPVTTYDVSEGPIALMPGEEQTNCITLHMTNPEGGYVRRFRADLTPGSHHMIVYQSLDTVENLTPTPCQALGGILNGEHPVFIAQQPHADLVFPTDENNVPVGFQLAAHQMVKIELHAINTTQAPIAVTGVAHLDTVPLSTKVTLSDMAFWGTHNINIPPNGSYDTGVLFQQALQGTRSFAVTTHQHHLGTEMRVWYASGPSDMTHLVADSTTWANPPLVMLDPALAFPVNGSMGYAYECHWDNPTPIPVGFGEKFTDEMCFLWHYYYPSQGFQVCFDGICL